MASCISEKTVSESILCVGNVMIIAAVAAAIACFAFQIKGVMGQAVGRPLFALSMTTGCVGVFFCLSVYVITNKKQNEANIVDSRHQAHATISSFKRSLLIGLASAVTLLALAICFQRGSLSLHSFAKASLISSVVSMTLMILNHKYCSQPHSS